MELVFSTQRIRSEDASFHKRQGTKPRSTPQMTSLSCWRLMWSNSRSCGSRDMQWYSLPYSSYSGIQSCILSIIHPIWFDYVPGLGFIYRPSVFCAVKIIQLTIVPFSCHQSMWHLRIGGCTPFSCGHDPLVTSSSPVAQPAIHLVSLCFLCFPPSIEMRRGILDAWIRVRVHIVPLGSETWPCRHGQGIRELYPYFRRVIDLGLCCRRVTEECTARDSMSASQL